MNILFLTDLYPIDENDFQTSSALKDFVEKFREFGHNVQVIRPNFLLNSFPFTKKKSFSGDIPKMRKCNLSILSQEMKGNFFIIYLYTYLFYCTAW